jgi:predicted secreted protein
VRWTSILAIYFLMVIGSAFLLLPFGVKTSEEVGEEIGRGHAESAPYQFSFGRLMLKAAICAVVLTALFDLNYIFGWITADDLDFYRRIFG